MAVFTVFRRGLVEEHRFALEILHQFVTIAAADILVRARQRKLRSLVMVERRRLPLGGIVTIGARRHFTLGELAAMRVGVALLALQRRFGEIGFDQLRPEVGRLVAIDAGDRAVRTNQGKLRFAVIEAGEVFPVLGGVAGFATETGSVGPQRFHAVGKLVAVRILVAGDAGNILEMINRRGPVMRRLGWCC